MIIENGNYKQRSKKSEKTNRTFITLYIVFKNNKIKLFDLRMLA